MNFKKYHVSRNFLNFDDLKNAQSGTIYTLGGTGYNVPHLLTLDLKPNTTYTLSSNYVRTSSNLNIVYFQYADIEYAVSSNNSPSFTTTTGIVKIGFFDTRTGADEFLSGTAVLMLNEGSTALPYEPYGNTWTNTPHYIHNTSTDTITSLPAVLYPNDTTATVGLKGNTVQSGTPTPDNPIMPEGTGEKTAQLFEGKIANCSIDANGRLMGNPDFDMYIAKIEQGVTYTASALITGGFYTTKPIIGSISYDGQRMAFAPATFTAPITGYVTFRVNSGSSEPMMNTGSTALPYEPYGYKIPISSANTTTPVYLGEVESTRKIKKYEFTGQETDLKMQAAITATNAIQLPTTLSDYKREPFICSHMEVTSSSSESSTHGFYGQFLTLCFALSMGLDTLEKVRTYLQQQYAAGTPVTVWYVLKTPTTGIVNEPLMKIGTYADEVSGITIPVTAGGNTLSVDTTVQPSEVTVNYKGWHPVADVHEKSAQLIPEIVQGGVSIDGSFTNSPSRVRTVYIPVKPSTTYSVGSGNLYLAVGCYYNNGVFVSQIDEVVGITTSASFTVPENVNQIAIGFRTANGTTNITPSDLQNYMLNEGSTALPYEPYWT